MDRTQNGIEEHKLDRWTIFAVACRDDEHSWVDDLQEHVVLGDDGNHLLV